MAKRRSVTIVAAWITFSGLVLAAIISVVFTPWLQTQVQTPQISTANYEREQLLPKNTTVNEANIISKDKVTNEEYKKAPKISSPLDLTYLIMGLHNSGGEWKEVPIWSGASLYSGDCFKVSFKTNEDCFVYVFLYGSGGIAQCLFPHEKISFENYIKGDMLYAVPDGDNWYYLDEVPGVETIYIVACYEQMDNIAEILKRMEKVDMQRQLALSKDIQRGIIDIQTYALESGKNSVGQRGVSKVAPGPFWNLTHGGNTIKAITEVIHGNRAIVKVVSFNHR